MEYIKIFIIVQVIFLALQFIPSFSLNNYQYSELIFGSFFIIVFFGIFGSILTLDFLNPEGDLLNNSALFAVFYAIFIYIA